jgi:hypothetical protein
MPRVAKRGGRSLPHARYGVDLAKVPDTYIEPFVAYRAWNWTSEGLTSLNKELWTPKVAFEAKCHYADGLRSMKAAALTPGAQKFWNSKQHLVPDPTCTCGMYAGINMQHLIAINYIQRGIHGEVHLWGRLYRHTLGWRAQYASPKSFIVPSNMIPFDIREAKRRLDMLTEFGIDIYLQPEREARVGQENIPLWIKDFGYSQQGLSWLVEKRKNWYAEHPKTHTLAVGDRVAVFGASGGIGIVKEISNGDMYYTMFKPNVIYRKPVKDVKWNDSNWRWETTGVGFMRKLEQADGALTKCLPLGGDRCRS